MFSSLTCKGVFDFSKVSLLSLFHSGPLVPGERQEEAPWSLHRNCAESNGAGEGGQEGPPTSSLKGTLYEGAGGGQQG